MLLIFFFTFLTLRVTTLSLLMIITSIFLWNITIDQNLILSITEQPLHNLNLNSTIILILWIYLLNIITSYTLLHIPLIFKNWTPNRLINKYIQFSKKYDGFSNTFFHKHFSLYYFIKHLKTIELCTITFLVIKLKEKNYSITQKLFAQYQNKTIIS